MSFSATIKIKSKICKMLAIMIVLMASATSASGEELASIKPTKPDTFVISSNKGKKAKMSKDSVMHYVPKKSKDAIDEKIDYSASDSAIFYLGGVAILYGDAKITYGDMELTSASIRMNMDSSIVQARSATDSTGEVIGAPVFTDKSDKYESEAIDYNFKTQKGLIRGVTTQQGEGYVTSSLAKKEDDGSFQMIDGKYTTCNDHKNPHFYLDLTKAKVKPNEYVVAGPAYMVLLDVPIPFVLPFGYFPFTSTYSSGLLMPSYGDDSRQGFYLRNGGYYFAINDYVDLAIRGDIYTKGSWALNGTSRYKKRYKYSGNFFVNYQKTVYGEEKWLSEYSDASDLKLMWKHQQDPKANPFSTLSASVDFASSSYNKNNVDSYYNTATYAENNKSSSVNYSLTIPNSVFSLSTNATLNQRRSDSTLTLSLPNIYANVSRFYPLKKKKSVGKDKWYEKIYLNYNMNFNNTYTTKEDRFALDDIFSKGSNGFKNSASTGASYTLFKYLVMTPGISYNERWYFKKYRQKWDEDKQVVSVDTLTGFFRVYDVSTKLDFSTELYGFYRPLIGKKISMIRHVFRPTVGLSWVPVIDNDNMSSYMRPTPGTGEMSSVKYNMFAGSLFGASTSRDAGYINFSMNNNVEMKVHSDKDSTGYKKISLIDNLSASGNYNLFADSLKMSDISSTLRLKITKDVSLTVMAGFTPYTNQLNKYGNVTKCNVTEWEKNHRPLRMKNVQTSFGYTFSNNMFKKDKNGESMNDPNANENNDREGFDEQAEQNSKKKENVDENGYTKFNMPWSFRFDYSVGYGDVSFDKKRMRYRQDITHSLNFSGNIQFTSNWSANFSSGYDFENKYISYTSVGITRRMHCWSTSLTMVPFGSNFSYNFRIGVNASMLQDLKYEQRKNSSDFPVWQENW